MVIVLIALFMALILVGISIMSKLSYAHNHFKMKKLITARSLVDDLPSVSVCIPARNEMHALTACLENVIASRYPKLEIIVLDDSSADKTSVLIKSFASAGVRFVEGSPLPVGWLGKNHALQGLLEEASGSYILFVDVDTQIGPDTIEELVAYARQENAEMVSVLPRREDGWRLSVIFSPLRYFWELVLHSHHSPATASNAWMIKRSVLTDEFDGFTPFKEAIQPEAQYSSRLMARNAYRFLIGTPLIAVSYEKKWQSQVDTSVRLSFPLIGGRVWRATLGCIGLLILLSPVVTLIGALYTIFSALHWLALSTYLLYTAVYAMYLSQVWRKAWWLAAFLWPLTVLQELVILIVSTGRYLTKSVTWKNRPVTTTDVHLRAR
ncbi:MAG: hypothetical protein JWN33_459 [Candidatus Saccharibacteria bacterium]|nr:hypothetical protein [Candidatus Saccharibacteria bacterium]